MEQVISGNSDSSFQQRRSAEDASINWVKPALTHGYLEARYVRRTPEYLVVYLSTQSGCAQACRMCHLTATKQTKFENASPAELLAQARVVLDWYTREEAPAKIVHFNFMARGEPLNSGDFLDNADGVLRLLADEARSRGLLPRYLISTILPKSFQGRSLVETFPTMLPDVYYSLYSVNDSFRAKWVPQAMPVEQALGLLVEWQRHTSKIPKIHYAFIEGENDSEQDVRAVCDAINDVGLRVNVNVVRYNPPTPEHGREPSEEVLQRNATLFRTLLQHSRVKVIARVGFDVKASCGMFIGKDGK